MRRILFIIEKEFRQISRNTILLRMMLAAPVMQLIMLSYAANFEVKNLRICVLDQDRTTASRRLIAKFGYIDNFRFGGHIDSDLQVYPQLLEDKADMVLVIPPHFERDLMRVQSAPVQLLVNAIDGSKAGIGSGYAQQIIRSFGQEFQIEWLAVSPTQPQGIRVEPQYWYNPRLQYRTFMVPGILFELLILIGGMISALNIVREKEIGTQEQLNVTPIRKHEFILGKLTPFVLIGLLQFTIGLLVAVLLFDVPVEGSIALMYGFAFLFLVLSVSLGLLISTLSDTQQQATFAIFFCLVLFILLSGLFSSTDQMPAWAKVLNLSNPLKYIIEAGRHIMLKGSTWQDLQGQFWSLTAMCAGLILLASWRYRKTA